MKCNKSPNTLDLIVSLDLDYFEAIKRRGQTGSQISVFTLTLDNCC